MSVNYAEAAAREIDEALEFLEQRSPSAALSLLESLRKIEQRLGSHPFVGSRVMGRERSMRRVVVQSYLLFYRVIGSDVIVIGLRRAARDPSSIPS